MFSQTSEIRGKKEDGAATFTFQSTPDEEELKQTRGSLFFLIALAGDQPEDKKLILARQLFDSFKNYFYTASGSNLKVLEEALNQFSASLKQQALKADLVIGNLWGSVLYVTKLGDTGVVLVRDGKARKIEVVRTASGVLKDKDTVFFVDPKFLANVGIDFLGQFASGDDFNELVRTIKQAVQEREGTAFCVRLSVQEPVETVQPVFIADLDKDKGSGVVLVVTRSEVWKEKILPFFRALPNKLSFLDKYWVKAKELTRKAAPYVKEALRRISFFILSPWLPPQPGELGDRTVRKRQRVFQIVVFLAALLLISIVVGFVNHNSRQSREKYEKAINTIENKLEDAENLKDINSAQAATYLQEAADALDKLSENDLKVKELQKKLESLFAQINKIFSVTLTNAADLSVLKGGVKTSGLKFASGAVLVLDSGTGSVYKVDLATSEPSIIVSEKKGLQNIAVSGSALYTQTNDGIFKVDIETGAETSVTSASQEWKKIIAADAYRGNLYLLDPTANQIWKYVPAGNGLGGPQNYFSQELKFDPTSFAVDGALWVSSKDKIFKFFAGGEDPFSITNLPKPFADIANIFTGEGLKNLYILDKGQSGIFVVEKSSGKYLGFYKNKDLKDADAIVVNEAAKTVYVLVKDGVKSLRLK